MSSAAQLKIIRGHPSLTLTRWWNCFFELFIALCRADTKSVSQSASQNTVDNGLTLTCLTRVLSLTYSNKVVNGDGGDMVMVVQRRSSVV